MSRAEQSYPRKSQKFLSVRPSQKRNLSNFGALDPQVNENCEGMARAGRGVWGDGRKRQGRMDPARTEE